TSDLGRATCGGWSRADARRADADGWRHAARPPVSHDAGHPARWGGLSLAEQHSPDTVRSGNAAARLPAHAICRRLGGDVPESASRCATKILATLGVQLNLRKTRIVHVRQGIAFLGYTIRRGRRQLHLPATRIKSNARRGGLYAYPTQKSIDRFKDTVRRKTQRRIPLSTAELIRELNPVIRGWGEYYKRAHVRRLFHQLDGWVERRLWSHRFRRW